MKTVFYHKYWLHDNKIYQSCFTQLVPSVVAAWHEDLHWSILQSPLRWVAIKDGSMVRRYSTLQYTLKFVEKHSTFIGTHFLSIKVHAQDIGMLYEYAY